MMTASGGSGFISPSIEASGKQWGRAVVLALALAAAVAGCAGPTPPAGPGIFWPKPPAVKRIAFIGEISKPADLDIKGGVLGQVVDYIVGRPEMAVVSPYGVAADADGRLFVVDTFLRKVHVFDEAADDYFAFPPDPAMLASPVGIAADGGGRLFVTDSKSGDVKVFGDHGRRFVRAFGGDVLKRPTGIAVNSLTSELLVVDTLAARVFRFDLPALSLKGAFGGQGKGQGRFHYPTNIAVSANGDIMVSDSLNFRVQVFSAQGEFKFTFGKMGDAPGTFARPKGVAADSEGNIYVVDALFDNVQVFDRRGRLLMAFGGHGKGPGEFWLPTGIHIDAADTIYVSDASNKRVQVFQYLEADGE